ncbi:MAG: ferrochelatase [Methylococcales bacterium]|nr:ferrochelatase [Methylococcales bacterium]
MQPQNRLGSEKTAVLLVNLGSPDAPTTSAVRRFLKDFLWDPRVVNIPRPIWWLILHLFVLPFRPRKSAHAYQKVWTEKGSPLVFLTRQLTEQVQQELSNDEFMVDYAMSYCKPSIAEKLRAFKKSGVKKIIILPLYPQYSSTTTASVHDSVVKEFSTWKHIPSFTFISDYCADEQYIEAVAHSIQAARKNDSSDLLVMSFHGLPQQLIKWGDPYCCQCHKTGALIAEKLGLEKHQWTLVFQSRFGKAEWLKPYCVDTLMQLPQQGIKHIDVVCPGFAVDCLETLEEIAMENKSIFLNAGGETYNYIPALNDSKAHALSLVNVIKQAC